MRRVKSDEFIIGLALWYSSHADATIRSTAKEFGISKSSVQKYFANDLEKISPVLYEKVQVKIQENIERVRMNFVKVKVEPVIIVERKSNIFTKIKNVLYKK